MQGLASCFPRILYPASCILVLTTSHRRPTIVTQVTIAVANGDRAAVVAGWGVGLEVGELFAAGGRRAAVFEHYPGAGEQLDVDLGVAVGVTVGMAICLSVAVTVRVAVGFGRRKRGGFAFGFVGGGFGLGG